MKSITTLRYWDRSVKQAIKLLAETALNGHALESARLRVEHARDILYDLCQTMERNGDAEAFEPLYRRIFDGLSFATSMLVSRPFSIVLLREGLAALRSIERMEVSQ